MSSISEGWEENPGGGRWYFNGLASPPHPVLCLPGAVSLAASLVLSLAVPDVPERFRGTWEWPWITQAGESQAGMGRKALKPREMQQGQRAGLLPARGPGKSTQRMTSRCDN